MLSIVVTCRNDDYGGGFRARLFRSVKHNSILLSRCSLQFEYVICEWNPLPGEALLSDDLVETFSFARAIVVPPAIHESYNLNPSMTFHEAAAKNAGIRRARGDWILVTNADILFDDALVGKLGENLDAGTFYRAHRIDVPSDAPWPDLKEPSKQLPSGEGRTCPPFYLGAGGDFMLASKEVWMKTSGLNEAIRWTTRAKDWQFLLGLGARGIPIEFLGNVYHLDHEEGFRNAPASTRDNAAAHFGGLWDFEFGVPVHNRRAWGLNECTHEAGSSRRLETLKTDCPLFSADEQHEDQLWRQWLQASDDAPDESGLWLLYSILATAVNRSRLVVRPQNGRSAVAAAGTASVAISEGLPVFCKWHWPVCTWMTLPAFQSEPIPLQPTDLVLRERNDSWALKSAQGDPLPPPFPSNLPPELPRFNRLLTRRFLRALLRCRVAGFRRIALFGAGGHTKELLRWGLPDWIQCPALLSTTGTEDPIRGIPITPIRDFNFAAVDAILLSSLSYEGEMLEELHQHAPEARVLPLYSDWKVDR